MKTKAIPKARPSRKAAEGQQKAKLFVNGSSQAVRLPKEFRFQGREVFISKQGNKVVLEPVQDKFDWQAWWDSWTAAADDFMPNGREQWPDQERDLNFD